MTLLTVMGGLTVATVVFFWGYVKLALSDSDDAGNVLTAYWAFVLAWIAYVFLPGFFHGFNTVAGFVAGVLL